MVRSSLFVFVSLCLCNFALSQITQNVTRQTATIGSWGGFVRDNQGNFLSTGQVTNTANFGGSTFSSYGMFLVKFDANLNHVFSTQYGSSYTYATGVATDSQNNIILGGYWYNSNLTFGGPTLVYSGNTAAFLTKLNPQGQHIWSQKYNGTAVNYDVYTTAVAVGADDSIVTCGYFWGNATVGGPVLVGAGNNFDWYVAKYAANGAHLWSFRLGGSSTDQAKSIAVDASGNVLVGGNYDSTNFVINGFTLPSGTTENLVVKIDPNGSILWYKSFGSSGADTLTAVTFDLSGNVLATGYTPGTIDLTQIYNGANDAYVIKYSSSGTYLWSRLMGASGNDYSYDVRCGVNDTIYITGQYTYNASLGGSGLPNTTVGMFIAKYASDGSHIWSRGYNSTQNYAVGRALAVDTPWSRVAYGFDYIGSLNFGGITLVSLGSTSTQGFVLLNEVGAVVPSPSPSPVAPSASPSPVPSGSPSSTPSISPSPSTTPSPSATPSPTVCLPCVSNADCSNGQGICSNATSPKYCSCLSGFGGCNCNLRPASSCEASYQQVTDLYASFKANASIDYQGYNLFVSVEAPLQETSISNPSSGNSANSAPYSTETVLYFGESLAAHPNCTFPLRPTWSDEAATPGRCYDVYSANLTWAFARNSCGFVAANNTKNYTSQLTVLRKYALSTGMERVEQSTRILNVIFPTEVSLAQSFVTVTFPAAGLAAAITYVDYNPSTDYWVVRVATSVDANYYISNSSSVSYVTSTLASLSRVPSLEVSPCTISNLVCNQYLTYTFPQGYALDACQGLFGNVITYVDIQCAAGTCASTNSSQLTVGLDTGDSCPVTETIDFSVSTLTAYQDSSLATVQYLFDSNDVVYFGVDLQTSEAVISSRSIKSGSVCFQQGSGSCVPVQYSILASPVNGKDPVFSVNLAAPANQAIFGGVITATPYTVRAVVQVSFAGAKGLRVKNLPASQAVDLTFQALVQAAPTPSVLPSASPSPADEAMSSAWRFVPGVTWILLLAYLFV